MYGARQRLAVAILGAFLAMGGLTNAAIAQVPQQLSYQGYLTNPAGQALTTAPDSPLTMVFSLYNVPVSGTPLWSETQPVVVTSGLFNVVLGSVTQLTLPFDQQYYLEVTAGTETLTPRQPLVSSPYALRAGSVDRPSGATGDAATISGGSNNTAAGAYASIGGGRYNVVDGGDATIGGGLGNVAAGYAAVIAGGYDNTASGIRSSVGGGYGNIASEDTSAIGGGYFNLASGSGAYIGGGQSNVASGYGATVSGGGDNKASQTWAAVCGGGANVASGYASTVGGGLGNVASGIGSFAIGWGASTQTTDPVPIVHNGTFIFADYSGHPFHTVADNEFAVKATGGVRFVTATDLWGNTTNQVSFDTAGNVIASGVFNSTSDRNMKDGFAKVDVGEVLEKVAALHLTTWHYKSDGDGTKHMGPVAQEFHGEFGLGKDDKHIATVDADGVALAAIQGLYLAIKARDTEIEGQRQEIADLKDRLADVESLRGQLTALQAALTELKDERRTAVVSVK